MNRIRRTALLTAVTALGFCSLTQARGPAERLGERLDLNAQQSATLAVLFEEHRDHLASEIEWRDAQGRPNPEARAQVEAARRALDAEIRSILTPEQAAEYEAIRARMARHKIRERREHGMVGALSRLDLSDEQKDALRVMRIEHRTQRHQDREQRRADLESILTPEQLETLHVLREAHPGRQNG